MFLYRGFLGWRRINELAVMVWTVVVFNTGQGLESECSRVVEQPLPDPACVILGFETIGLRDMGHCDGVPSRYEGTMGLAFSCLDMLEGIMMNGKGRMLPWGLLGLTAVQYSLSYHYEWEGFGSRQCTDLVREPACFLDIDAFSSC
jgi:hypothetical protein